MSEAAFVDVTLPIRTVSEANVRTHWRAKAKRTKSQRMMTTFGLVVRLRQAGLTRPISDVNVAANRFRHAVEPVCELDVFVTRIAPSAGLDMDNLLSSQKGTVDGIADALGIDDRDPRVAWHYGQCRGAPRQYAVRIEIRRRGESRTEERDAAISTVGGPVRGPAVVLQRRGGKRGAA